MIPSLPLYWPQVDLKGKQCYRKDFPGSTVVKNTPANAGDSEDTGLILGLERSPEVGNGNPL